MKGARPEQGEVEAALQGHPSAAATALPRAEMILATAAGTDPLELLHSAPLLAGREFPRARRARRSSRPEGSPGVEPSLPGPRPGVRNRHTPIPDGPSGGKGTPVGRLSTGYSAAELRSELGAATVSRTPAS